MARDIKNQGNITSIVNPTDEDLMIPGELLGIDIHHSSFSVRYQRVSPFTNMASQHIPHELIFPLNELRRFFLINGNQTSFSFCTRPCPDADWVMDCDGMGKKPHLERLLAYAARELAKLDL